MQILYTRETKNLNVYNSYLQFLAHLYGACCKLMASDVICVVCGA